MENVVDVRKTISDLILESSEENIKGKAFRQKSWLNQIRFNDVMDIVLFYISLQADVDEIGKIKGQDFCCLIKDVWEQWVKEKKNETFFELNAAWLPVPGPMDGGAGPAEMYMTYFPALSGYKYLFWFFNYPKGVSGGWLLHKKGVQNMVFPKWKRKHNFKKLPLVFDLAEMICEEVRKQTAER